MKIYTKIETFLKKEKNINEGLEDYIIDGERQINDIENKINVGLFFWNTKLSDEKKIEISNWFNSLSKKEQEYVETLRNERTDEVEFDMNDR